eukprot:PhM_4_TR3719/c0_g1_i1/m.76393
MTGCCYDPTDPHNVYVSVYDITQSMNVVLDAFGLGVHHSGIEVHGLEVAYGRSLEGDLGVSIVPPRRYPQHVYRGRVWLGRTNLSRAQFDDLVVSFSRTWPGTSYHLIRRNCNAFSKALAAELLSSGVVAVPFPSWVNRLSAFGLAVLPTRLVEKIEEFDADVYRRMMDVIYNNSNSSDGVV